MWESVENLKGPWVTVAFLLFFVCLGLAVTVFSAGRPMPLLRGLFGTLMDLMVAPFAYLRGAVDRLSREGGQSVRMRVSDPQFLLRTQVRIQLAALFVLLSLVGAFGLVLLVLVSIDPSVPRARDEAVRQLEQLRETEIPRIQKELKVLQTAPGWDPAGKAELEKRTTKLKEIDGRLEELRRKLQTSSEEHFGPIQSFLGRRVSAGQSASSREEIRQAVVNYLGQSSTSSEFDADALAYTDLLFEKADLEGEVREIERKNPAAEIAAKRAALELELKETKQRAEQLAEEASLLKLFETVSLERLSWGFLVLVAFVWGVLWLGGLAIETMELFIEMATNLRRLRRVAEGNPAGTLIEPRVTPPSL
jgi:hypothetical protein